MKNLKLIALLALCFLPFASQAQGVLQEVSDATCECVKEKIPDDASSKEMEMKLGLCMLEATNGRQDRIKRDLGIDMNSLEGMEQLGEVVGTDLATSCDDFMALIIKSMEDENSMSYRALEEEFATSKNFTGTVVEIEKGNLMALRVQSRGATYTFYCIREFEGVGVIQLGYSLKGKEVSIDYRETEIYDHKMGKFVDHKEIVAIRLM